MNERVLFAICLVVPTLSASRVLQTSLMLWPPAQCHILGRVGAWLNDIAGVDYHILVRLHV